MGRVVAVGPLTLAFRFLLMVFAKSRLPGKCQDQCLRSQLFGFRKSRRFLRFGFLLFGYLSFGGLLQFRLYRSVLAFQIQNITPARGQNEN